MRQHHRVGDLDQSVLGVLQLHHLALSEYTAQVHPRLLAAVVGFLVTAMFVAVERLLVLVA